jgi:hypothetical protein
MNKVYLHKPLAADAQLGYVDERGKVHQTRFGPDKYVGWVELESGKIYENRLGPDNYIGRVDLRDGRIYLEKIGPDEYVGRVEEDGRLFSHAARAFDPYVGKVEDMISIAHGGAAYLLLVLPRLEEAQKTDNQE